MRAMLTRVCNILTVVGIDGSKIKAAVARLDFSDIEDCLQSVCAEDCGAEFIVTRNVKDFESSRVNAVAPDDFLERIAT